MNGCSHERHHHSHYHWDNAHVANEFNTTNHARCNDDMEHITNHRNKNPKAGKPEVANVRFGTVDVVDYIPTKNRYEMLSDSVGCYEHSIDMSTLERISESKNVSVGAVTSHKRVYDKTGRYVKLTCTSDSGAGESVLPCDWFPEISAERSEESSTTYASANGSILPNKGKKSLKGFTDEGKRMQMNWQLADVTKPLASIGRLTDKGHRVVFDNSEDGGGYILHKDTNTRTKMRKANGTYEFDVWVEVPKRGVNAVFPRPANHP